MRRSIRTVDRISLQAYIRSLSEPAVYALDVWSLIAGIRWERKWSSLKCSGLGISRFFREKKLGTQKQDWERRPLAYEPLVKMCNSKQGNMGTK